MASDANRLKRLLEMIIRNDQASVLSEAGSKPAGVDFFTLFVQEPNSLRSTRWQLSTEPCTFKSRSISDYYHPNSWGWMCRYVARSCSQTAMTADANRLKRSSISGRFETCWHCFLFIHLCPFHPRTLDMHLSMNLCAINAETTPLDIERRQDLWLLPRKAAHGNERTSVI